MSADEQQSRDGGLSRRQLLTRGAIAGGLIWAAPVIRTTAAYATTANGTERPCTDFFMVTIDPSGKVRPQPRDLNTRDVPPAIRQWFADNPAVQVQFPAVLPLLTQTSGSAWAVLLPEVTGPNASGRQCRMVIGWDEKRHKYAEGYVDPNPPLASEVGRRLVFPCPDPGHDGNGGGGGDGNGGGNGGGGNGGGDDGHGHGGGGNGGGGNGGGGNGGGDDGGGCATGHDDGDHDHDDIGCDPTATATAAGSTGTGTADAVVSPDASLSASGAPSASAAAGTIGSDGSNSSGAVSSDGNPSPTVSSDGSPSKTPSKDHPKDSGACINLVYLIYCCPR